MSTIPMPDWLIAVFVIVCAAYVISHDARVRAWLDGER